MQRDLDLEAIWDLVVRSIREVRAALGDDGYAIRGLGVAANRQTLIVEDAGGGVLLASGNDDLRASMQGAALDETNGGALFQATGHAPAMIFWPGKLAWIDAFAPEIRDRAARVLSLESWIVQRMSGHACLSVCSAAETGARHLRDERWVTEHLPGWAHPLLPEIASTPSAGPITSERAGEIGLQVDCQIALGQPDTQTGEFAARGSRGAVSDFAALGWSATVVRPAEGACIAPGVWQTRSIGGGRLAESNAGEAASGYGWLRRRSPTGELTEHVTGSRCAADEGVFAPTGLRVMDVSEPGLGFAAMLAPVPFAAGTPDLDVLGTAVLEDVGFAVRANREQLGPGPAAQAPVRLAGGYLAPTAAPQLLADVLGAPVDAYARVPVTALGAAMCAAAASGDMSLSDAQAALAPTPTAIEPDAARARAYAEHYARWTELRRVIEGFFQEHL